MLTSREGRRVGAKLLRDCYGLKAPAPISVGLVLDLMTDIDQLEAENKRLQHQLHCLSRKED